MRVTVGMVVGLLASGHSNAEVLAAYPSLTREDVQAALAYAADTLAHETIVLQPA
jgi:uncharacterized protein (DUF433 family)